MKKCMLKKILSWNALKNLEMRNFSLINKFDKIINYYKLGNRIINKYLNKLRDKVLAYNRHINETSASSSIKILYDCYPYTEYKIYCTLS